ncbi:pyrroline-5-carboxylate reductase [Candidatus Fukatsuia anoeciicola]|uniref:pyrroline-5-carboxylate reductase n=1 Tax=Candidatus Fukatsuia anoeciicola TaxID=2994492 RepID=UPI003464066F
MKNRKIVFIGAGNMSRAIISGLIFSGYPATKISVCAPSADKRNALSKEFNITNSSNNIASTQQAEVIILAVKPQVMIEVCQSLQDGGINFSNKLILSVAAGIKISRFYDLLGDKLNIIRVMPNMPVLVRKGMSGLFAPTHINQADRNFTEYLLCSIGKICWLKSEQDINKVIATTGSAPAYFFLLMEAMQQQAIKQGFNEATARLLVQQAASGALALVEANSQLPLSKLREQVTSKGGTTAAALKVFKEQDLSGIISCAMQAATFRGEEMEKLF